jgi:xanthine dehydrogenase molybdopterin-binding subunit B
MTHSPDTYKIPTAKDIPGDFRVKLLENAANPNAIHGSKTVAEPPFMLSLSAWLAIKDAVSAVGCHETEPEFSLPATNEVILLSIEKLRTLTKESASGKVPI